MQTAFRDVLHVLFLKIHKFLNSDVLSNTYTYKVTTKGIIILLGVNFMKMMLNKSCIFNIFAVNTEYFMHITDLI